MAAHPHLPGILSESKQKLYQAVLDCIHNYANLVAINSWNDALVPKPLIERILIDVKSTFFLEEPNKELAEKTCELIRCLYTLRWKDGLDLMRAFKANEIIGNHLLIMGLERLSDVCLDWAHKEHFIQTAILLSCENFKSFLIEFQKMMGLLRVKTLTNKNNQFFDEMLSVSFNKGIWDFFNFLTTQMQVPVNPKLRDAHTYRSLDFTNQSPEGFIQALNSIRMNVQLSGLIATEELIEKLKLPPENSPVFLLYMKEMQDRIMLAHIWGTCEHSQLENFSFDLGGTQGYLVREKLKIAIKKFYTVQEEMALLSKSIQAATKLEIKDIDEILQKAKNDLLAAQVWDRHPATVSLDNKNVEEKAAQDTYPNIQLILVGLTTKPSNHAVSLGFYKQYCLFMNRGGGSKNNPSIFPHKPGVSLYDCGSPEKAQTLIQILRETKDLTSFISKLEHNSKFIEEFPMKTQESSNCGTIAAKGCYFFSVYFRTLEILKPDNKNPLLCAEVARIALKQFSHYWRMLSLSDYINKQDKIEQDRPLLERIYVKNLCKLHPGWQNERNQTVLKLFKNTHIVVSQKAWLEKMLHCVETGRIEKIKIIAPNLSKETLQQNATELLNAAYYGMAEGAELKLKKEDIELRIDILKFLFDLGLNPNQLSGTLPFFSYIIFDFIKVRTQVEKRFERDIYLRLLKLSQDTLLRNQEKPTIEEPYFFYESLLEQQKLQPDEEADGLIRAIFPPAKPPSCCVIF